MPQKSFALDPGGSERLEVSWRGTFKSLTLGLDGQTVASFGDPKALKDPQRVALPDGSTLEVQLATVFFMPELRLVRDGEPVPGSASDPAVRHAAAWHIVAAVAILNLVVGLLVEVFDADFLRGIGAGWPSVLTALVYGVLAFFVRGRSRVALGLAVGLFILDGIFVFAAAARATSTPPMGGLIARIFFLMPMLRGFAAIRELERPRRPRRPVTRPALGPAPASPAAPASKAKVLDGEAEKRRLQMTERVAAAPAPTVVGRGPVAMKGKASPDAVKGALRFVAHRCEIGEAGLRVTLPNGQKREMAWTQVARVVVRQLPPDPPWDSAVILDLVGDARGQQQPIRVFGTTAVNYNALSGGASTSRIENIRKLARHARERHPQLQLDAETLEFLDGQKAPARFANMTQFVEYDAAYA